MQSSQQALGYKGLAVFLGTCLIRVLASALGLHGAAPVLASSTFGGARFRWWQAMGLVLAIMVCTDLALYAMRHFDEQYAPWDLSRLYVYPIFLVQILLAKLIIRQGKWWQIGGASLLGSVVFFLGSNLGAWLDPQTGYTRDLAGLAHCYWLGLLWELQQSRTFLWDLAYTAGYFGVEFLAARVLSAAKPAAVEGADA